VPAPEGADRAELVRDLGRVADRLRTAPLARLTRAEDGASTPADQALLLLQQLADLEAGATAREDDGAPTWRTVPDLGPTALGDQLTVLGTDLGAAVLDLPDPTPVWTPVGRSTLGSELASLAVALRALRHSL
jgi:hypothetical protein